MQANAAQVLAERAAELAAPAREVESMIPGVAGRLQRIAADLEDEKLQILAIGTAGESEAQLDLPADVTGHLIVRARPLHGNERHEVRGLEPETTYYFTVHTETDPHPNNQSALVSDPSAEVNGATTATVDYAISIEKATDGVDADVADRIHQNIDPAS